MTFQIKKLPKSEIEISGELTAGEFAKFWQKAVKELAAEVTLPGFRPGNVPEKILLEKIGEEAILNRAGELAVSKVYPEIAEEQKLDVIGRPSAAVTKIGRTADFGFKIKAAVLPEMLPPENFKEIARKVMEKKEEITVEEKDIEEVMKQLQNMRTKEGEEPASTRGEPPEINDEFAKSVGKFETIADLKKAVGENLKLEKEDKAKEKKRLEVLDRILEKTEVEIPDVLVEGEKRKMLEELKARIGNMGLNWRDYVSHIKKEKDLSAEALPDRQAGLAKAEEEMLEGWNSEALKRVKYGLLLRKLSEDLKVEVEEKEIEEKIVSFHIHDDIGVDRDRLKDYAYGIIRNEKVFSALEGGGSALPNRQAGSG